jgi:DNA mismatch endonuclease, patch repair protein
MARNRRRDTAPERALRRVLHAHGRRYRVDYAVRVGGILVKPDVVFTRARVAVFVDGCFWHGCPAHGTTPSRNAEYWSAKLARNRARDARVNALLAEAGWVVVRGWEHEPVEAVVERVVNAIDRR